MMKCSLNEVETTLIKAARGNGADPALAARFARAAVVCLCETAQSALINQALSELPKGAILEMAIALQSALALADEQGALIEAENDLMRGYVLSLPNKVEDQGGGKLLVHLNTLEKYKTPARLEVSQEDMQHWQKLAAKTFVPETEQSRLAGAGAGLTDND